MRFHLLKTLLVLFACLSGAPSCGAYSVFTHEQIIDLSWKDLIEPLLLARFPHASEEDRRRAHSYAYGGCAIQDLGYYPFGQEFFSDLTHYVRTGDFIAALFRDARTIDEYAFAIGALTHYFGDNIGHQDAVNRATALAFPKLARKYGSSVTYDESPHAHVRVEFAFDIGELSKRRLAPAAYLRYIGFRVPRRLLAQAFTETYALPLGGVLGSSRPAIRTYRFSVRSLLPRFAYAETVLHRSDFPPDAQSPEFQEFFERLQRADFKSVWEPYRRRRPRLLTYLTAGLIVIVPKIGPASDLAIKVPDGQTQSLYIASVNRTVELSQDFFKRLKADPAVIESIPNRDLDTGELTRPGAYPLTDKTYAKLLHRVTEHPERPVPPGLRKNILGFYADPTVPITTKKSEKEWRRVTADLRRLEQLPVGNPPAAGGDLDEP